MTGERLRKRKICGIMKLSNFLIKEDKLMKNSVKKSLAAALALTMALSSASMLAGCGGGSFAVDSIAITNAASLDLAYDVGETVNLSNMSIKVTFNDQTTKTIALSDVKVFLDGADITSNLNKITESAGTKTIVIKYEDKQVSLTVTVGGASQSVFGVSFESPAAYVDYKATKDLAGTKAYGEAGYESQFMKSTSTYKVGDDNGFKYVPVLKVLNDEDEPETLLAFEANSALSVWDATTEAYVALSKTEDTQDDTKVNYAADSTVYAVEAMNANSYDFTDAAVGKKFKLSVLPSDKYQFSSAPTASVIEFEVVDGFNAYNIKDLAVMENNEATEVYNGLPTKIRSYWDSYKETAGIPNYNAKSVVFHNDMSLTAADLPEGLKYTLDQEVVYKDKSTGDLVPGSSTFLYNQQPEPDGDNPDIFSHVIREGESFAMYGNYFSIDLSESPYVCAFKNEVQPDGYGGDYSNATLFAIRGLDAQGKWAGMQGNFFLENLDVKGNANIGDLVTNDAEENPVYAGGLMFIKTSHCTSVIDNVVARTSFITFFPDRTCSMTLKDTKCFDSFQDALFSYGQNTIALENCTFERAGGPLMMIQHVYDSTEYPGAPTVTADLNCEFMNLIGGQEFWFNAMGAAQQVSQIKALNGVFMGATDNPLAPVYKSITNNGAFAQDDVEGLAAAKMNFIALFMVDGDFNAITTLDSEGKFTYGDKVVLDRMDDSAMGAKVHGVLGTAAAGGAIGITFNTENEIGYMNPDMTPNFALPDQADRTMEFIGELISSQHVTINLGGFGMLFGLFDIPKQA